MSYTSYVLTEQSRADLLAKFPPKFPDVIAHHVTYQFGVSISGPLPPKAIIEIIGYSVDDSLETLIVNVDGTHKRLDGKVYHITLSLDRSKNRKPVESNKVIIANGWFPVARLTIQTAPELCK